MRYLFVCLCLVYCNLFSLAQDIPEIDFIKYQKAYNYIFSDSILKDRSIWISRSIVDLDRFLSADDARLYPDMNDTINSLNKFEREEDFYSLSLDSLFKYQSRDAEFIAFFSRIEKNTLRVDLFTKRKSLERYNHLGILRFREDEILEDPNHWVVIDYNHDKVYTYLFIFDSDKNLEKVFRYELIYGI